MLAVLTLLLGLAQARGHVPVRPGPHDAEMRRARVCYDHLAGELGIALYRALHAGGALALASDGVDLTDHGHGVLGVRRGHLQPRRLVRVHGLRGG